MAKRGRKPKGVRWEELPEEVRADVDRAIEAESSETVRQIYARFGLSQRGYSYVSFEKHAARKRRQARGQRIESRLSAVDDPRTEAELIAELRRRAYVEAIAALQAGDAKLYEVISTLSRVHDFDRLQMERAAEKRANEKHAAWRDEWRKQKAEADSKLDRIAVEKGIPDAVRDSIKDLYGIAI